MSSQGNEALKNEPLEWFFIAFIAFIIAIFMISKYHMDIWYQSKKAVFTVLNVAPESVNKYLFSYAPGAAELIPLAHADLIHHKKDFKTYYKIDKVGQRKKKNIDKAVWRIFSLPTFLIIAFIVYRETRKKFGLIDKPGGRNAMYSYIRTMHDIFPYIKPAIPYMEKVSDMQNIDTGWYAVAKLPLAWVKENNLTTIFSLDKQRSLITKRQRLKFALNVDATYCALRDQLGRPWTSVYDLTFIEKCALIIICPHVYGRTKESRLNNRFLLNHLDALRAITETVGSDGKVPSVSDKSKKEVLDFVDASLKKYASAFEMPWFELTEFDEPFDPIIASFESLNSEAHMEEKARNNIRQVLLGFRYVNTIFLALFDRAWMYGVLSSSEILWMKEFNRPFYYVLAQQGRLSCFVETAGPWAHYLAERAHGFRMLSPQLYEALLAIDRDLFETHDNYTYVVDWSDSAKWNKMVPDLSDSNDQSGTSGRNERNGMSSLL